MHNNHKQHQISYRTVPAMVTESLREAILNGELGGGMQLKQEELAVRFAVSMSALREALKNLEAEGLVTFYPNRGAVVSQLSAAEAEEIFDIRLLLELGALELAIPCITAEDLTQAEHALDQLDRESCNSCWSELNWRFHEALYRPARRPRLLGLIQSMHNNVGRYMRLYLAVMNYQSRSQQEHWQLFHACAARDIQTAQAVLRTHLEHARKDLAGYLIDCNQK